MMTPEHPDLATEREHLNSTLAVLEARIEEVGNIEPHGATAYDTHVLLQSLRAVYRNLILARKQVYFGRLDIAPGGHVEDQIHYLGRIGFDQNGKILVVDWRA